MPRKLEEWIGASPDTPIPDRVRVRVFERDKGRCQCCDRFIAAGDLWQTDHTVAIINGGENREANLRTLLDACHKAKTKGDVAEKSVIYKKKLARMGLKKSKWRPMAGTKRSGWKRKMDGTVERRR